MVRQGLRQQPPSQSPNRLRRKQRLLGSKRNLYLDACYRFQYTQSTCNPATACAQAIVLANANLLEISGFEHKLRQNNVMLGLHLISSFCIGKLQLYSILPGLARNLHEPLVCCPGMQPWREHWCSPWRRRPYRSAKPVRNWRHGMFYTRPSINQACMHVHVQ